MLTDGRNSTIWESRMTRPMVFCGPQFRADTDAVLRRMAKALGIQHAVFLRKAFADLSGTEPLTPEEIALVSEVRLEAARTQRVSAKLVNCGFNLAPETDAELRRLAVAYDLPHYVFLRRALEYLTATGHAAPAMVEATVELRATVSSRLQKFHGADERRTERRKKRKAEREGLSVVASTRDTFARREIRRERPANSVRAATSDEPVRRRRRRPLRL